jgi:replicative DNA helicase
MNNELPGLKKARRNHGDRLPPHDLEAERGVLGCVLTAPEASLGLIAERMKPAGAAMFYDLAHQTIYGVCHEMHASQHPIDLITLQARLRERKVLDEVGGLQFLSDLQDAVPSAANLPAYLDVVRDKWLLRQLLGIVTGAADRAYEYSGAASQLLLEVESEISKLTEEETTAGESHIGKVMGRVIADMEAWHYSRGSQQLRGLETGPAGNYLDKVLMGIRERDMVVIAGRPGEGKTAMALNITEHLAEHHVWYEPTGAKVIVDGLERDETVERKGIPVAVFSLEMDEESLGYRLVFGRAGVSEAKYNQGFSESGDAHKLVQASHELSRLNIYIDATPGQTIGQIAAKARRMVKQYGIKLFVLDYLQLAQSDDEDDEDRVRVSKISQKIVSLKKQLGVPWLVLAQLNRNIETAERDRPPILSDLQGSGSIEQDADKVVILRKTPRRDLEAPKAQADGTEQSDRELLERICADWDWSTRPRRVDPWVVKNRRGPTGKSESVFQGNLCRFTDWHLFKVAHGVEERKAGESKHLAGPAAAELEAVAKGE